RSQRGWCRLRRSGGARVQVARQELARRNDDGDAGGRARQSFHSYAIEAVPNRKGDQAVTTRWAALGVVMLFGSLVLTTRMAAQTSRFTPVGTIPVAAELIRVQSDRVYLAAGGTLTVVDS